MGSAPPPSIVLALVAWTATACGSEPKPSAVLITLDTTVPEALSCYGGPPGVTPNIDTVAREGVSYRAARTVAPLTLPAHASVLTGLYPLRHTVRTNGVMGLPESAETLAERARERGLQTAAFVGAVVLHSEFGLGQGFELYGEPEKEGSQRGLEYAERPAQEVADATLSWLRERDPDRPFFLWVHFFDPHQPLEPPDSHRARAGGDPYLGEVSYVDHELGRILDALRDQGVYDDTTVVIVADHGEGRGRHGESTHGAFAFDTTLFVPLILRRPDGWRAGERSNEVVSVVDVYPTLLDAMGLGAAGAVDGQSLFAEIPPNRGVYFENYNGFLAYGWSPIAGWTDGRGKYLHSSAPEFFDLSKDRGETKNDFGPRRDETERFRAAIAELDARPKLELDEAGTDELLWQIEKLGYAGLGGDLEGLPGPLEPTKRLSPHRRIEPYRQLQVAQQYSSLERPQEALPLLRAILSGNPENHTARITLGNCLVQLGHYREALSELHRALDQRGGGSRELYISMAVAHHHLGEVDRAIEAYKEVIARDPRLVEFLDSLIALLRAKGRTEELREYEALRAQAD